jgi:hypothetical protein
VGSARDRGVCGVLALALSLAAACTTARDAATPRLQSPVPGPPAATAIAPVAPPGLDGTAGVPPGNACTAVDRAALGRSLGGAVTARPNSWNDAGVPSLDLCVLVLTRTGAPARTVLVAVSALPAQPNMLERLYRTLGQQPAEAPEIGADARYDRLGVAYRVGDRAVRLTSEPGLARADAATVASAVSPVVLASVPPARMADAACQPAGAQAEQFLGASAQLRRDYRVRGGLTCIWGTAERTVSIVESLPGKEVADPLPEARHTPKPVPAPVGDQGYFLAETGELVFRTGRRVVRVAALAEPPVPVTMERLLDIVEPIMPLFLR